MRTFDQITEMPARWARAMTLRSEGHTYQTIGNERGVSVNRAWQIVRAAKRRARIIEAAAATAKVCALAFMLSLAAGTRSCGFT